jgi:hypothetical protein
MFVKNCEDMWVICCSIFSSGSCADVNFNFGNRKKCLLARDQECRVTETAGVLFFVRNVWTESAVCMDILL